MSGDRCVLWLARGLTPDPELLGALERKGLTVEACSSAYEALARICVASRLGADASRASAAVLLLCDPDRLDRAGEVAALAERYAPRSKSWVFESGSRRLRAATAEDTARWNGTEVRFGSAVQGANAHGAQSRPAVAVAMAAAPAPSAVRPGSPALRLSGRGTLPPISDADPLATPDKTGATGESEGSTLQNGPADLLTDEELAMLLSPDDPARQD